MNRIITLEDLTSHDACVAQVDMFKIAYPDGFEVTVENLLEAKANGFEVFWTQCMLSASGMEVYGAVCDSACGAYQAVVVPARKDYVAVSTPAWEAYYKAARVSTLEACQAAIAPAREVYETAIVPALEVYEAVRASAYEAYGAARIKALADVLNGEQA
jgi:hypothetical protein